MDHVEQINNQAERGLRERCVRIRPADGEGLTLRKVKVAAWWIRSLCHPSAELR